MAKSWAAYGVIMALSWGASRPLVAEEKAVAEQRDWRSVAALETLSNLDVQLTNGVRSSTDRFSCDVTHTFTDALGRRVAYTYHIQRERDHCAILTVVDNGRAHALLQDGRCLFVAPAADYDVVWIERRPFEFMLPEPPDPEDPQQGPLGIMQIHFAIARDPKHADEPDLKQGSTLFIHLGVLCKAVGRDFDHVRIGRNGWEIRATGGPRDKRTFVEADIARGKPGNSLKVPISRFRARFPSGDTLEIANIRERDAARTNLARITWKDLRDSGITFAPTPLDDGGLETAFTTSDMRPTKRQRDRGEKLFRLLVTVEDGPAEAELP